MSVRGFGHVRDDVLKKYSTGFVVFDKRCVVDSRFAEDYVYFKDIDELKKRYRDYNGKETSVFGRLILNLDDEPWKYTSRQSRTIYDEDLAWREILKRRSASIVFSAKNGRIAW